VKHAYIILRTATYICDSISTKLPTKKKWQITIIYNKRNGIYRRWGQQLL